MPRKTIVIYEGDDFERLSTLRAEVGIAERQLSEALLVASTAPARFGDDDPDEITALRESLKAAQDAYDSFVDVAAERADEWVIESIGHEAWRDLLTAHPARKVLANPTAPPNPGETVIVDTREVDHPDDEAFGVNTEEFGKALLLFVDPDDDEHRTVTKAGDADLARLGTRVRRLSQGQFDTLWMSAFYLNTGGVADPKLSRYSIAPRSSES
jgi:hypothetical protein